MYNLIEYSGNFSKISESLYSGEVAQSKFWINQIRDKNITKTPLDGNTKYVEIVVPLKYLSNFWRTLKMPLINWKINLVLTWLVDCVISSATVKAKFAIEVTKLYVLAVGFSTFCFII